MELLQAWKKDDREFYRQIKEIAKRVVYTHWGVVSDPQELEEAMASIICYAIRKIREIKFSKTQGKFSTWVYALLRNGLTIYLNDRRKPAEKEVLQDKEILGSDSRFDPFHNSFFTGESFVDTTILEDRGGFFRELSSISHTGTVERESLNRLPASVRGCVLAHLWAWVYGKYDTEAANG